MSPLLERVLQTIRKESLVHADGRVLVALSGGADSVALTLLLQDIAPEGEFAGLGLLHLNHQLRETADEDERFCRLFAKRLSLPIEVRRADVQGRARRERISVEEAGHRERYAFFRDAVAGMPSSATVRVATAHTRHDQAETLLMRLVRGAGPGGLSGIHPRSGHVIRPLLDVGRPELRKYLADRGQTYREDETNRDLSVTRNRVRHELIPFLEERFSPSVVDTLARDAKIARHDAEWLDAVANRSASTIVKYEDGSSWLHVESLTGQPVALARRIAKRALEHVTGHTAGFAQVERVLALASGEATSGEVDLPGCRVRRSRDRVHVGPPLSRAARPSASEGFVYPLPVPGEVSIPEAGVVVSARPAAGGAAGDRLAARSGHVYIAGEHLTDSLIVRSWRPGDSLRPLGLGGRKKLQDLFVDEKVARSARHRVPIVTDRNGGIVWVVGHTVADDFRVTARTEGVLLLRVRDLGGAG